MLSPRYRQTASKNIAEGLRACKKSAKNRFSIELLTLVAMKVLSLFCAAFMAFVAFAASTVDDCGTDRLRDASAEEATSDDNELLDLG